jgi:hypothetical protein
MPAEAAAPSRGPQEVEVLNTIAVSTPGVIVSRVAATTYRSMS